MLPNLKHEIHDRRLSTRRCRAGLTALEFIGCLTAVLGGAWIGALYLGVNIQHIAHTALEQADLLEKVPLQFRPEAPKQNVVTREQLVATLRKELGSLRSEIYSLRNGSESASSAEESSTAVSAAKTSTRTYWLRLSEIALGEEALQRDAETALDGTNAAKVFAIKGRVSRFAAKGVEAVPSEGVDEAVVKFGRQLGLWYDRAGELYERAMRIWETPTGQQARAQLTEEWTRAELQHRHEARLLRERAAALRGSISRQFGEEFPEFAKPVAPASQESPSETTAATATPETPSETTAAPPAAQSEITAAPEASATPQTPSESTAATE
jgi:hypothetical protein